MRKNAPGPWEFLRSWLFPGVPHYRRFLRGASWSGFEKNHLFLNGLGAQFTDVSAISGLDADGDGRAFALIDLDFDGFQDVVQVNANTPFTQVFRNRASELKYARDHGFVAVRLFGGNRSAEPSASVSNRDAIGAKVTLEAGSLELVRELRAGEGFASQSSRTLLIGIGRNSAVQSLQVRWPSGRTSRVEGVPSGSRVDVYEDPEQSPDGGHFAVSVYGGERGEPAAHRRRPERGRTLDLAAEAGVTARSELLLYTTLATWCENCARETGAFRRLGEAFSPEELALFGVPYDASDTPAGLLEWVERHDAPYEVLTALSREQVDRFLAVQTERLRADGLPVSIVTDALGQVLLTRFGPPTLSEIRALASAQRAADR